MIQHIALTVNEPDEIGKFYENILLFSRKYKFSMDGALSQQIFKTEEIVDVHIIHYQGVQLEIFLSSQKENKVFSHVCMAYRDAKNIHAKALKNGYKTLVKENTASKTYFIWDKSGNLFEIKEMEDI